MPRPAARAPADRDVLAPRPEVAVAGGTLTVPKAAEYTGLSETTLWDLMKAGELSYTNVGTRRLIPLKSLLRLLGENFNAGRC